MTSTFFEKIGHVWKVLVVLNKVWYLPTEFFKHAFLCVWQSPVQLDDFDAYIKDMAKDSDYKFSLQFEVSE